MNPLKKLKQLVMTKTQMTEKQYKLAIAGTFVGSTLAIPVVALATIPGLIGPTIAALWLAQVLTMIEIFRAIKEKAQAA